MSGRAVDSADLAALPVARNVFRASSMPALTLPPCRLPEIHFGRPSPALTRAEMNFGELSHLPIACPAPLPPGQLPDISGVQYACPAPLPPGQLPKIHFGRPVCLPCPAAAWSVARNSFRAPGVPAPLRCRPAGCPKFISGVQYACPAPLSQRTIFTPPAPAAI